MSSTFDLLVLIDELLLHFENTSTTTGNLNHEIDDILNNLDDIRYNELRIELQFVNWRDQHIVLLLKWMLQHKFKDEMSFDDYFNDVLLMKLCINNVNKLPQSSYQDLRQCIGNIKHKDIKIIRSKYTLPFSLQCFINWVTAIEDKATVIDLRFDEINNDIKHQIKKYKNNKEQLKKVYYNFDAPDKNDYCWTQTETALTHQNRLFFYGEESIIHYILRHGTIFYMDYRNSTIFTKQDLLKAMKQSCNILKSLIINGVVHCDDALLCQTYGQSIFERICYLLKRFATTKYFDEKKKTDLIIDSLIELILVCMDKKDGEQQAILNVVSTKWEWDHRTDYHDRERNDVRCLSIYDCDNYLGENGSLPDSALITNECNVLHKLLLRGMLPFQFTNKYVRIRGEDGDEKRSIERSNIIKQPFENICTVQYIDDLFEEHGITFIIDDDESPTLAQYSIIAPLSLYPYLCKAKEEMFNVLSTEMDNNGYIENESLCKVCIQVIISYIYIDYDVFYCKTLRENLKIKALNFVNNVAQFEMNDDYINNVFNKIYNNKEFISYLFNDDNFNVDIICIFCMTPHSNFDVLHKLILLYNQYNKDSQFPLHGYGINYLLQTMVMHWGFHVDDHQIETLIQYLKLATTLNGDKFDINNIFPNENNSEHRCIHRGGGVAWYNQNYDAFTIIGGMLSSQHGRISKPVMDGIEYILTHYNYDVKTQTLLDSAIIQRHENLIQCLLVKCVDKYDYSLGDIYQIVLNTIQKSKMVNNEWKRGDRFEFKQFIKLFEKCLEIRCNASNDKQMMDDTLEMMTQWMNKIFKSESVLHQEMIQSVEDFKIMQLSMVDAENRNLFFGYCREHNPYYNMSIAIQHLCLTYFYESSVRGFGCWNPDKFEMSNNNTLSKGISEDCEGWFIYAEQPDDGYSNGIHYFSVKMLTAYCYRNIGVTSIKNDDWLCSASEDWKKEGCYSYYGSSSKAKDGRRHNWSEGDTVTVKLDCDQFKVTYFYNKQQIFTEDLVSETEITYYFAMSVCAQSSNNGGCYQCINTFTC